LCDQHAGPLASGEPANSLIQIFSRKKKSFGPGTDVDDAILINHRVAVRRERLAQGNVRIEFAVLVEVHYSQSLGTANFAGLWLDVSAQQAQQGCLAAAVWTHQPHSHPGRHAELNVIE